MGFARSDWKLLVADFAMFGVAFGLTSLVSYLYVVVAGRTLVEAEFGVSNALVGLISMFGFFAASVQLAATRASTRNPSRETVIALTRRMLFLAAPVLVVITLAAVPFAPAIGATAWQIVLCGGIAYSALVGCPPLGFLAAIGRIRAQAGIGLLGALARIGSGWPLMLVGFGATGVVIGFLVNNAVVLLLACWWSWRFAPAPRSEQSERLPGFGLDSSAVATFTLVFAPFSLDQVQVQLFAPSMGGNYAALATIAKIVFFSTYPLIAVAYPRLLKVDGLGDRSRLLLLSVVCVAFVAFGFAGLLANYRDEVERALFAGRFASVVPHLASLVFGVACFAVSTLAAHALVAWDCRFGYLPSLVAAAAGVVLFATRHESLSDVVGNQTAVYLLQTFLLLALLAFRLVSAHEPTQPTLAREKVIAR